MQNLIIKVDNMHRDPICNMDVDGNTKFKSSYNGRTYYFCSASCKQTFDKKPENYVKG